MLATQSTLQSTRSVVRTPCCVPQQTKSRAAACRASKETPQAGSNLLVPLSFGLVAPSLPALQAFADEVAPPQGGPPMIFGLPVQEVLILTAPVLLYTIFTVWRTTFNPNLKILDFMFAVVSAVIVINISSILIFKIRFF